MALRERFTETLKEAMKAKDTLRLEAVRMAISEMKKRDIEARATGNMNCQPVNDANGMISQL